MNDEEVSVERQPRGEAQAAVEALRRVLVALVLRDVLLELDAVVRDEAALGAAELSLRTLRRRSLGAAGAILLLRPSIHGYAFGNRPLQITQVTGF